MERKYETLKRKVETLKDTFKRDDERGTFNQLILIKLFSRILNSYCNVA